MFVKQSHCRRMNQRSAEPSNQKIVGFIKIKTLGLIFDIICPADIHFEHILFVLTKCDNFYLKLVWLNVNMILFSLLPKLDMFMTNLYQT